MSNWLPNNVRVGDRIEVSGPRGKFCLEPGSIPKKLLLVGAGSGVTPVMSMARWLCDLSADVDVRFFNCVKTPDDVIFRREIELIASRYRRFVPFITVSRPTADGSWTGLTGRLDARMLDTIAPDLKERHVYMCGPEPFMSATRQLLQESGFDMSHFHQESFGGVRTSARSKLVAGAAPGLPTAAAGALRVEFARTGRSVTTEGATSLLEVAEENDVDLDYGCRTGSCGDCKAKLLKGTVNAETSDGLTDEERGAGYVLTCVARPTTSCVLDC